MMNIKSLVLSGYFFLLAGSSLEAQTKAVNAFYFITEIVADSKGNLFVTGKNKRIIKITPNGDAYDFAGSLKGFSGIKDGRAAEAMFSNPTGLAIDANDNIYVADYNAIRKVTPEGVVTTISGNPNKAAIQDGNKNTAAFNRIGCIAIDNNGTLYVTDYILDKQQNQSFNIIRKISPAGNVHTIKNPDGSPFRVHSIEGLACDKQGNLYASVMAWSSCITKISPDETISTVAGVYDENVKNRSYFKDGDIKTARVISPRGIAITDNGEILYSDRLLHRILKIANNQLTIVAGGGGKSATGINIMGGGGSGGYVDARGRQAEFTGPYGIAFDRHGNLFVADGPSSNSYIRKLSPDGMVTTFCKQVYNPGTKQFETITETNTVVINKPDNKPDTQTPKTGLEKKLDSIFKDPAIEKRIKEAQVLIQKPLNANTSPRGPDPLKDDTTSYTLPGKNIGALGRIPAKTLSAPELREYATYLYKILAPAFRSGYSTPIVNTDSYNANTISNAAVLATEAGRLDQAILLSLKAVEKNPENPVVLNNTGAILQKGGLEIAAITVLEVANQKDPGNSTVQNNLGQAYLILGDRQKAEQHLQRSISTSPYHPHANSSLALISYEKGNKQSALKYTENSLRGCFTDKAWHLLYKLKRDATLMDYFRHRYRQPEYFNEDKYRLPMQCEKVTDIPAKKAEYEAYKNMLVKVRAKFDAMAKEEMKLATESMVQQAKKGQIYQPPFMQLAGAMMMDITFRMDKSGEWEKVGKSQQQYKEQISQLQNEYNKKRSNVQGCGGQIALANEYMEKMSIVTREYQKTYLRIYKDFYHDMTFWGFFYAPDAHYRRGSFCSQASGLLGVLLQLAETHFLTVTIDCGSNEKLKREVEDIKITADCPTGDGIEIPFGVGKFNLSCEKWDLQLGEALVFNVGYKFTTGETTWAIGPGVGVSLIGSSAESIKSVPQLKAGPIKPGLEAGLKAQAFFTFRNGALVDWGGIFEAELDLLGVASELKAGYTIGANSGLQLPDGAMKNFIDTHLGPEKEAPQMNKNVKPYKAQ